MQRVRLNLTNFLYYISTWFTTCAILAYISVAGTQNGAFDDIVIRLIALIGFCGIIIIQGLKIINYRNQTEFWIYRED